MFNSIFLFRIYTWLSYQWKARDKFALHSPFVYHLYSEIIHTKDRFYAFPFIENLRKELLASKEVIQVKDLGAGSIHQPNTTQKKTSAIAKYAAISPKKGELLFKLVNHFQPEIMLELGTSLGLGTLYMKSAFQKGRLYTFEGCPQTLAIAKRTIGYSKLDKIEYIEGNIDETLPVCLEKLPRVDFVFFDANHRFEPSLRYFEICLGKAHPETLFVFDDIYWSAEMGSAWKKISEDSRVSLSIDLYGLGLVFFKENRAKEHFVLRF